MNELLLETIESRQEGYGCEASVCPMHSLNPQPSIINAEDELVLPKHKRMVAQYTTGSSGLTELHLHYGEKEISFDEPDLFAFGEGLTKQSSFVAGAAINWGDGYDWPRVRELLEQLLREGVLKRAEENGTESRFIPGVRPSLLPPAETTQAHTWLECEGIMRELTGQPLELGYLELVIPIYRVAHIALDAEGRQVGEANVYPSKLRLDVPTEWRTCTYAGSRYMDDLPMNVTALKSMSKHWEQMMMGLLTIREAYLRRFPKARNGWTVGDLHRLSTLVLTIPAYQLMHSRQAVMNGELHPVLSCMYRVTDGVRMVMQEMLVVMIDGSTLAPDAYVTSADIYAYAERNHVFHSDYGVCAGPKVMIEELLNVLVDGRPIAGGGSVVLEDAVQRALADLEPAFDYCLLGLQSYALMFSLWPAMGMAYEQLLAILDASPANDNFGIASEFRERLMNGVQNMLASNGMKAEERRLSRERVYADMYGQSAFGLGSVSPSATLAEAIAPIHCAQHRQAEDKLQSMLRPRLFPIAVNAIDDLVAVLMDYFQQEQAIVRAGYETQQLINRLLGRKLASQPLKAADLNLFYKLQAVEFRQPYLVDDLEEILGLRIIVTPDSIDIFESGAD